ncbi:hypothetical protein CAOG_09202 [Capsaspora owczarzaki ATCC 30864]|uniref:hypothetical protein n=1 Tax=Capsaspora owczarzaki (strain ATCC 30864) TaxID=595528 RepID=UPI0003524E84|nr:hypothetical protein CAOG_09202 [Capsaspora owczarzaki ATCC 30864]|eukprot:XP_011270919.1 hypothetical protein CAOG_09202 [Capsaspora owczarzaki ATCC 30864]
MPKRQNEAQATESRAPRKCVHLEDPERKRIIDLAVDRALPLVTVASMLHHPISTVSNVVQRFKERGEWTSHHVNPKGCRVLTAEHLHFLEMELDKNVNVTNQELQDLLLTTFGIQVHQATIGRAMLRQGFTFKRVYEQVKVKNSPEIKAQRKKWAELFEAFQTPVDRLFYVDESGFNANQHRTRGRSRKGARAIVQVGSIRAANFTLIAAIGMSGVVLNEIQLGGVTGHVFAEAMTKLFDKLEAKNAVDTAASGIAVDELPVQQLEPDLPLTNVVEDSVSISNAVHMPLLTSGAASSQPPAPPAAVVSSAASAAGGEEHPGVSFPGHHRYKAWIVLDNARIHKTPEVRELFARRGYGMLFLPPYSSFLNPIEYVFNQVKAAFKRSRLEPNETISSRITAAVGTVTATHCQNTITHVQLKYFNACHEMHDVLD